MEVKTAGKNDGQTVKGTRISSNERFNVYNLALHTFGAGPQMIVALEELSEAQKEICKALRGKCNPENLAEELADAFIMLEQVMKMFHLDYEVEAVMVEKIERLQNRINNASNKCDNTQEEKI